MVIKKFVAKNLPEALTRVKKDFGDEAVILKTRFNSNGSDKDSKLVEVTAAVDNDSVKTGNFKADTITKGENQTIEKEKKANETKPDSGLKLADLPDDGEPYSIPSPERINRLTNLDRKIGGNDGSANTEILKDLESKPLPSEILAEIKLELSQVSEELRRIATDNETQKSGQAQDEHIIGEIKNEISRLVRQNEKSVFGVPKPMALEYIRLLVGMHVPEEMATEITKTVPENILNGQNTETGIDSLIEIISGLLGPGEPLKLAENKPTIVTLVGPTGSGKSSAAARLAFKYSLEENRSVTLITTDTFRADSKEQLKSSANVINCSFISVASPQELAATIKSLKEDLVIVDTSGVSCPRDMDDLAGMVSAANPHEVHLVVPADMPAIDLADFVQNYPEIGIDKVLVTKLDQTIYRGGIIGAAAKLGLKFSYESSSRELPGKFNQFDPSAFVSVMKSIREKAFTAQD